MSLQVWLPLVRDLNNQGLSSSVISSVGSGVSLNDNGKLGKCYYFDGTTNGYMLTDFSTNVGTKDFSIALWVKIPTITSGSYFTICSSKGQSGASAGLGIYWNYSQKKFLWSTSDGTATEIWQADTVDTIVYDKWIHLVMVRESADAKHGYFYINGIRYELASVPAIRNITASTATLYLGKISNGAYPLKMYLNDFRFYDHALSPKEVKVISQGLVCHYTLGDIGGCPNLLPYSKVSTTNKNLLKTNMLSSWNNLSITTIDGFDAYLYPTAQTSTWFSTGYWYRNMTANTTYTYSAYIYQDSSSSYSFNFTSLGHFQVYNSSSTASDKSHEDVVSARVYSPATIPPKTWTKISITFTTNTLAGSNFQVYPRYNIGANTFNLYFRDCKLELGNKATPWLPNSVDPEYITMGYNDTTVYDSSGYNNHMTAYGSPTISANTVRNSVSTHFINGQYALAQSNSNVYLPKDAITVNIWMNCSTWGNPISCTEGGGWNFESASAGIQFPCYISGVGYKTANSGVTASTLLNAWHMLTGVFDGTSVKIYIDAELKTTTATGSTNGIGYAANRLVISGEAGSLTPASSTFVGEISDVRIYATPLSAEDIKALYQVGASIDKDGNMYAYEFNEV